MNGIAGRGTERRVRAAEREAQRAIGAWMWIVTNAEEGEGFIGEVTSVKVRSTGHDTPGMAWGLYVVTLRSKGGYERTFVMQELKELHNKHPFDGRQQ